MDRIINTPALINPQWSWNSCQIGCYNRCNVLQTFTNHFTNSSSVWRYGCKNLFCLYNIILEMVASPNNIKYRCNYFLSGVECTRGNRWNGIGFYCRRRAIIKTALTLYKVQGGWLVTRLSLGWGIWDIMKLFCENCHKTLRLVWLLSPTLLAALSVSLHSLMVACRISPSVSILRILDLQATGARILSLFLIQR